VSERVECVGRLIHTPHLDDPWLRCVDRCGRNTGNARSAWFDPSLGVLGRAWVSVDLQDTERSSATIGGGVSDLDQFGIEQDATRRGPRTRVETGVGKKICSEFADVSRRVRTGRFVRSGRRRSRTTGPVPVRESQAARCAGEQR
jgi:hypothetical protein